MSTPPNKQDIRQALGRNRLLHDVIHDLEASSNKTDNSRDIYITEMRRLSAAQLNWPRLACAALIFIVTSGVIILLSPEQIKSPSQTLTSTLSQSPRPVVQVLTNNNANRLEVLRSPTISRLHVLRTKDATNDHFVHLPPLTAVAVAQMQMPHSLQIRSTSQLSFRVETVSDEQLLSLPQVIAILGSGSEKRLALRGSHN